MTTRDITRIITLDITRIGTRDITRISTLNITRIGILDMTGKGNEQQGLGAGLSDDASGATNEGLFGDGDVLRILAMAKLATEIFVGDDADAGVEDVTEKSR